MADTPLHVMFLGLRDIDGGQGGVENHVKNLTTCLLDEGCKVTILARSCYCETGYYQEGALTVVPLPAPRKSSLEAIVHSVIGVFYAAIKRPDILHIQAIGPSIVTPLARLFGLRVVVTHHGKDYDREKWGRLATTILKAGERMQALFANARIVISSSLCSELGEKYPKAPYHFIPNGAPENVPVGDSELSQWDLEPSKYVLSVGRIVPEKRQLDLLRAFRAADLPDDVKLVIVGAADHENAYAQELQQEIGSDPKVVQTGFVKGAPLHQLFQNAGVFVLPSSHEGLPISLIEAMVHGCPIIASDITGNLEFGLGDASYFPLRDLPALTARLETAFENDVERCDWSTELAPYDWATIATQTHKVYKDIMG